MNTYPQNYLYLGVSSPLVLALFVVTLMKLIKNSQQRGLFVKLFLVTVLVVVVYNWFIKWVVNKDLQTVGWVLAVLPLLAVVFVGYYYVEHDKCLGSIHSMFSDCLPQRGYKMGQSLVARLS